MRPAATTKWQRRAAVASVVWLGDARPVISANTATAERGPPDRPMTCAQNAHKSRHKPLEGGFRLTVTSTAGNSLADFDIALATRERPEPEEATTMDRAARPW